MSKGYSSADSLSLEGEKLRFAESVGRAVGLRFADMLRKYITAFTSSIIAGISDISLIIGRFCSIIWFKFVQLLNRLIRPSSCTFCSSKALQPIHSDTRSSEASSKMDLKIAVEPAQS